MSVEVKDGRANLATHDERAGAAARAGEATTSVGLTIVRDVRLLLIAIWLGAAVGFSFAVAPSAFAVLPTHELAGNLVTRTLGIVNVAGLVVSLLLLVSAFIGRSTTSRRAWLLEVLSLVVVALTTFVGHWVINARLLALRRSLGRPIDDVATNDPVRVAFNSLHGYSVAALGLGMIAGALALLLIARRRVK
jgi:Domain of unknown function (DUF4149)